MAFPDPVPGLVIRYSYLWRRDYLSGQEEGQKDRPCAIVAAILDGDGEKRVLVLPVTHSMPNDPKRAVEIPAVVKARLGLDSERSWVIFSEWNEFTWPGPDVRNLPGSNPATIAYGLLPPRLFALLRDRFLDEVRSQKSRRIRRSE